MNLKSKICNWQKEGLQMANIIICGGGFQAAAAASKAASQAGNAQIYLQCKARKIKGDV